MSPSLKKVLRDHTKEVILFSCVSVFASFWLLILMTLMAGWFQVLKGWGWVE